MASMWDSNSKAVNEEEDHPWKEAINKGQGAKGLSEMCLRALPKAYIQPPKERLSLMTGVSPASGVTIPIIDMSKAEAAELICEAAEKWGFFQVVNHGVPAALMDNVMRAARRFFGQVAEEKRRFLKENSGCSNHVLYGTSFFPEAEKALEWSDYLTMHFFSEDEASSFWPAVSKDATIEYLKSCNTLIKRVLKILMNKLNANELDETNQSRTIQFNYYPICPTPDLSIGIRSHSDISLVTVLLQDDVGGLHMLREIDSGGKEWVHVKPVADSLVINIGDSLEIMSNGIYKSVEHYVVSNGSIDRMSIPIFVSPEKSSIVAPLPEVLATGKKAEYKEVVFSDYLKHFLSKPLNGKNTLEFAKI